MRDPETFLTELYVLVDTFCKAQWPPARRPGPAASLSTSEVVTLAIYGQWGRFPSERAFHRHASHHLRPLFPTLPSYPQYNRLVRHESPATTAFAVHLGQLLAAEDTPFEIIDGMGLRTRTGNRRGRGWLAGSIDKGRCSRLNYYHGVRLLACITPKGAITGWGLGPASTNDRVLAETFFAARTEPDEALACVGQPVSDCYLADMGFSGRACQARWHDAYQALVISPPQSDSRDAWAKPWRQWLAGHRQVIESVNARLLHPCRLDAERPHTLSGLVTRVAAAAGLHNVWCWFNQHEGRGLLSLADRMT